MKITDEQVDIVLREVGPKSWAICPNDMKAALESAFPEPPAAPEQMVRGVSDPEGERMTGAIILSREDADRIRIDACRNLMDNDCAILRNGSPGYSWLNLVDDDLLRLFDQSCYDSTVSYELMLRAKAKQERSRRELLELERRKQNAR